MNFLEYYIGHENQYKIKVLSLDYTSTSKHRFVELLKYSLTSNLKKKKENNTKEIGSG